jgi:hypothetical protein
MQNIMWPEFTTQGPGFAADSLDAFVETLEFLRNYDRTFHLVGTQFGEWQGDTYAGETYCIASHFYRQDGAEHKMDMGIRYRETIELREGTGKYLRRDLDVVWTEDRVMEGQT